MATIYTEIQFISPQQIVSIHLPEESNFGLSNHYRMHVRFNIRPISVWGITIQLRAIIVNNRLFSFEDGNNLMDCRFDNVLDGEVRMTLPFRVKNIAPLTGMQLVLATEAYDVADPKNKDFDSETYDVTCSSQSHIAARFFLAS
ncbi:hypothetical protein AHMF7605_08550 [Adhaeribacter arboris]|uniref:Uncharacterized protein n=1 Tax=Adhaeribacter arboris TaxID=2072846 RepID=A0A2T2YDK3_9BACT|nr:hypothetical protein [Adhaeribacter arboris]PSR53573.1 hypothetical protein AHMF7605_08550 [Adhaeribacter arboris]